MEKKERNMRKQEDNYKDEVLSLRRVTKVTKGGRTLHFSATVAVGDKKGKVCRKQYCRTGRDPGDCDDRCENHRTFVQGSPDSDHRR